MRRILVAVAPALVVVALVVPRAVGGVRHASPPPPVEASPVAPTGVGDVEHLTPALKRSVDRAIEAARAEGVALAVTSGWRSAEHQQRLFDDAVRKYGSRTVARQWVLPPSESAHVRGEAVDVGPPSGASWLETNGVRFGLCRRYANEPWHFERLAAAKGSRCPTLQPHA
ncbi:MAG: zinc D-Ala-D-Ala carboxypeptidase [Frankiaceae bacterium]|nr:zinc D-Ala-D-Ala carboxypeptidase [Frankiaceae bacterium]